MANEKKVFSVRLPEALTAELDARGEFATVLRGDLERYYTLLEATRRDLRERFSQAELLAICDICNGWASRMEPAKLLIGGLFAGERRLTVLGAEVEDGIRLDGLDAKWELDGPAFLAKLNALTPPETLSLVDAAERWWHNEERDPERIL